MKAFPMVGMALAGLVLQAVAAAAADQKALPKVIDFGDRFCIPCKLMAPELEALRAEQEGKLDVEFINVGETENVPLAQKHGIEMIPTQIFFDADGKEVWRHVGYISKTGILLKWRELGAELHPFGPAYKRLEASPDNRPKDAVCFLCDGDVDPRAMVTVPTEEGNVNLCSAHHLFVMLSCLQKDVETTENAALIADAATGAMIPATKASYLHRLEEASGRPAIQAFAARRDAEPPAPPRAAASSATMC
jgi:thioredoxin 1